ncbi:uncharacterized protein LOC144584119 [Pogona vitticeps]
MQSFIVHLRHPATSRNDRIQKGRRDMASCLQSPSQLGFESRGGDSRGLPSPLLSRQGREKVQFGAECRDRLLCVSCVVLSVSSFTRMQSFIVHLRHPATSRNDRIQKGRRDMASCLQSPSQLGFESRGGDSRGLPSPLLSRQGREKVQFGAECRDRLLCVSCVVLSVSSFTRMQSFIVHLRHPATSRNDRIQKGRRDMASCLQSPSQLGFESRGGDSRGLPSPLLSRQGREKVQFGAECRDRLLCVSCKLLFYYYSSSGFYCSCLLQRAQGGGSRAEGRLEDPLALLRDLAGRGGLFFFPVQAVNMQRGCQ